MAAGILPEVLDRWVKGKITPRPQNEAEATYSAAIKKEAGEIDWQLPATDIERRVRAFQPWPGAHTSRAGKRLEIVEAMALPGEAGHRAGEVVALKQGGVPFGVGTGEGILGIVKVQLQGKRALPAADFLRGQRRLIGASLPD
jgi:methionyl-tRNA formyltransferase